MSCNENKNPLKRGGTSRNQRLLDGLRPNYVNVEERDEADWIVFASKFSAFLNYYDNSNKPEGNWEAFFKSNTTAVLASIAVQSVDDYRLEIKKRFDILKDNELPLNLKKETLSSLFAATLTLGKAIDVNLSYHANDNDFKISVLNLIKSKLQPALYKLLTYYKGAKIAGLLKDTENPDWKIINISVARTSTLVTEGLSGVWTTGLGDWALYFAGISADEGIFGDQTWEKSQKIQHAANHNLFSVLFDRFLMGFSKIVNDAGVAGQKLLSDSNDHQPHYALFLTFVRLFKFAKDDINTLTGRHLDFYYKEVLRLKPQKAVPDKAHILVELAKHIDSYLLTKGTLFKAGKDETGKDVFYSLIQDTVFSKAKVARLMSVYKGNSEDNVDATIINTGRFFASPVANSADGLGGELKTPSKEWHPFVNKKFIEGRLTEVVAPKAELGFAVASHYLYLQEGERIIDIKFAGGISDWQQLLLHTADCYLTTEKGWFKVANKSWSTGTISGTSTPCFTLSVTLKGDDPAILNYTPAVHGRAFSTNLPLLKFVLVNNDSTDYNYTVFKDITISKIEIEVRCGLNTDDTHNTGGARNLLLQNDVGVIDASKPFLPFGQFPKSGASFIIGSEEIFKKKNAFVRLNLNWMDLPADPSDIDFDTLPGYAPASSFKYLGQGQWKSLSEDVNAVTGTESVNIPASGLQSLSGEAGNNETILTYTDTYLPYSTQSNKGFIKLAVEGNFGYDEYQKAYTNYLIGVANKTIDPAVTAAPVTPYIPKLKSFTLHYKASTIYDLTDSAAFENREVLFFNLYPFGEVELHKSLTNKDVSFLPQFVNETNGAENAGEFYIGLENLKSDSGVNILFQVLEGTANPKVDKPEEHVQWSYLSNNIWKTFTLRQITDNTGQLIKSGIISFIIPADATQENSILPPGFVWLRASVTAAADAVCKLISISAQASTVILQPEGGEFSVKPRSAGTITKLKDSTSSIKKIEQPFSSFGGQAVERSEEYYVRVSERLRHKNRAITIWDFEHLILAAFPAIYKVKCLNHTKLIGIDYNEVAPGHITIITIPDLLYRNDANPLRPFTNLDTLAEIKEFLESKVSCHVQIHAGQPQFEEIYLDFKLKLHDNLEFNFYADLLKQEITKFLTPWAYGTASIDFGGRVYKSVLINFIEEQSYVDYITDVSMYHRINENTPLQKTNTDVIEASTARSILVSAPASKHSIAPAIEFADQIEVEDCIDELNAD